MWLPGILTLLTAVAAQAGWLCPELTARPAAECSCALPHTLRCAGDHTALQIIGRHLREQRSRNKNTVVSLLDCALRGVSVLTAASVQELAGVGLHGLVISSGDIRRVQQGAFASLAATLYALGLPNNQLPSVPTEALTHLDRLDRLDLSNNKIHTLDSDSFKGITNITYLDLSDNQLTEISSDAFRPLLRLTALKLRGNMLKVAVLNSLKSAQFIRELDLSSNALEGPLGPTTLPNLEHLSSLQLADNTFASIRRGALSGLTNLTQLNLHNNQIDVLEDYAFKHLTNITMLDLSHNEIVAVSGASLAQLSQLRRLDLSHNFLRSLSAEPLKSLDKLTELLLHDNDISMIDDGALSEHKDLMRFTIEDNPLNCDCLMSSFARWLREANNLPQSDKSVAICATPPHLEGALLSRLSKNKLCDDEHLDTRNRDAITKNDDGIIDYSVVPNLKDVEGVSKVLADAKPSVQTDDSDDVNYIDPTKDGLDDDMYDEETDLATDEDLSISKTKVQLKEAWYDDTDIRLSWSTDPPGRHRCTGVTVSSDGGMPRHVACHRAMPDDVIVRGLKVDTGKVYTFCVAFEELSSSDVPIALALGCGSKSLRRRAPFVLPTEQVVVTTRPEVDLRVSEVRSNVTSDGLLTVLISLSGLPRSYPRSPLLIDPRYLNQLHNCYVVLAVLSRGSLVAQKDTPCKSNLEINMEGFIRGPYEVCATISKFKTKDPICVVPQFLEVASMEIKTGFRNVNTALVGVSLGLMVLVIGLVWFVRKMLKKPAPFETHRCFRQEPVAEETPRASYVMLATSKV